MYACEIKSCVYVPLVTFDLDAVALGLAPLLRRSDAGSRTGEPASRSDGCVPSTRWAAGARELASSLPMGLSRASAFSRSVPLTDDVEVTDFVISAADADDELLTDADVLTSVDDAVGLAEVDALQQQKSTYIEIVRAG